MLLSGNKQLLQVGQLVGNTLQRMGATMGHTRYQKQAPYTHKQNLQINLVKKLTLN